MEVRKTLQPGDMGTRRLLNMYGSKLVCVRYRIDKQQQKRYTTVELIVDEKPDINQKSRVIVWVKINYGEKELRKQAMVNGAKWLPEEKVWQISYDKAKKLGLKKRIVKRRVVANV